MMIDSETLKSRIGELCLNNDDLFSAKAYERIIGVIEAAPTIEAEPVVHSAWTVHDPDFNSYQCKNCGLAWMLNDGNPFENEMNYCPKCGARMDGGAENG